jgi:hypothetical protein
MHDEVAEYVFAVSAWERACVRCPWTILTIQWCRLQVTGAGRDGTGLVGVGGLLLGVVLLALRRGAQHQIFCRSTTSPISRPRAPPTPTPPPPHARHHAVQDHQEEPWLAAPPLCRRPRGAPGLQQVRHHRRRLVARPARERPRGKTRPSPQPLPLPWPRLHPPPDG